MTMKKIRKQLIEKLPSGEKSGTDVTRMYPEIMEYWMEKGYLPEEIKIISVQSVNEDQLYLKGKRFSKSCRTSQHWKYFSDLTLGELSDEQKKYLFLFQRFVIISCLIFGSLLITPLIFDNI